MCKSMRNGHDEQRGPQNQQPREIDANRDRPSAILIRWPWFATPAIRKLDPTGSERYGPTIVMLVGISDSADQPTKAVLTRRLRRLK
jgi:hypothetical protein